MAWAASLTERLLFFPVFKAESAAKPRHALVGFFREGEQGVEALARLADASAWDKARVSTPSPRGSQRSAWDSGAAREALGGEETGDLGAAAAVEDLDVPARSPVQLPHGGRWLSVDGITRCFRGRTHCRANGPTGLHQDKPSRRRGLGPASPLTWRVARWHAALLRRHNSQENLALRRCWRVPHGGVKWHAGTTHAPGLPPPALVVQSRPGEWRGGPSRRLGAGHPAPGRRSATRRRSHSRLRPPSRAVRSHSPPGRR
jgi:hypothetical protein